MDGLIHWVEDNRPQRGCRAFSVACVGIDDPFNSERLFTEGMFGAIGKYPNRCPECAKIQEDYLNLFGGRGGVITPVIFPLIRIKKILAKIKKAREEP